jgi:enoyl-[acyl-carrier protein] reductase II
MNSNKVTNLFGIKYPIVQGGMVWCSGWELASAVSNAGGLGLIGAGSMDAETLRIHIKKTKENTQNPFGVNIPMIKEGVAKLIEVVLEEDVKIVFTSAGNPMKFTSMFKERGIKVFHVIANSKFAKKAEEAGVDGIVSEGFEAGGHNGREETTTLMLIPQIRKITNLPLIAAGGIYSGATMLAAMTLGADGVQIGSRFAVSKESSAHNNFKEKVVSLLEGDTKLSLKKLTPVRLIKNEFYNDMTDAEQKGASVAELLKLLGRGKAKLGMFDGDMEKGELEIGQVSALIEQIESVDDIFTDILKEFNDLRKEIGTNERYMF